MISVRARVRGGVVEFSSAMVGHKFFEMADGKDILISIDDKPTSNMRRYFEGAVVPAVFYQHPHSGWENFKDAREALKLEFLPNYTKSIKGRKVRYSRSTTELSKAGFTKFLDAITRWMIENELEMPDPEDFKAWRDSAPSTGSIYPPVARLKEVYTKAINAVAKRTSRKKNSKKRNRTPGT